MLMPECSKFSIHYSTVKQIELPAYFRYFLLSILDMRKVYTTILQYWNHTFLRAFPKKSVQATFIAHGFYLCFWSNYQIKLFETPSFLSRRV